MKFALDEVKTKFVTPFDCECLNLLAVILSEFEVSDNVRKRAKVT